MQPQFTWDLVSDVRELFVFPFMVNALEAGTAVAILSAVIGWFVILRREAFVAHTLAVIGFPGASGALLFGAPPALGYFVFAGLGAAAIAPAAIAEGPRHESETATVGTVQAFALALGFLFVSLGHGNVSSAQALLFGSFLGISPQQVGILCTVAVLLLVAMGIAARPLLFASMDPEVAASRGVPTRALGWAFILLLGIAVAEASQITGSLLVFALLVIPAATGQALDARPFPSLLLTSIIAVVVTWLGLAASYYSDYPIGFTVTSFAFAMFLIVRGGSPAMRALRRRGR